MNEIDAATQADVDALNDWINDVFHEDNSDDMTQEDMVLASKGKMTQPSNAGSYLGAAAITAGVIGTALYLARKRQESKNIEDVYSRV